MPLPFRSSLCSLWSPGLIHQGRPCGNLHFLRRPLHDRPPNNDCYLPVGYGDGYSRLLTNRGDVLIRGRRFRIAGTVCMDHCMVDVGPGADVHPGDPAVLIGRDGGETITRGIWPKPWEPSLTK